MGHFLQITITRKTMDHFSRKTIQSLLIGNCRNGPLSANYDRNKNYKISQKNYTNSRDRGLQKRATFCKLRSQEKLDHFSRQTIKFLLIANCRNRPLSANYDRKKNYKISQEKLYKILMIANCRNRPLSANYDRMKSCANFS